MKDLPDGKLMEVVAAIQKFIVITLILLLLGVVVLGTVELAILLVQDLLDSANGYLLIDIGELLNLFSFFFLILIGLELLETIELYLKEDTVHAEVVLLVALIAVGRKVVVLDLNAYDSGTILGLAAIILALAASYFLIKHQYRPVHS